MPQLTDTHLAAADALQTLAEQADADGRTAEAATHRATALALLGPPDPVAAAPPSLSAAATGRVGRRRPAAMTPQPRNPSGGFVAASGGPLDDAGMVIALTAALNDAKSGFVGPHARPDGKVLVASVPADPSVPTLGDDHQANTRLMREGARALVAAGGICAPPSVMYSIRSVAGQQRPIRDALVPLMSDRGRVTYTRAPTLAAVAGGLSIWTNANDIAPANPATKNRLTLPCPDDVTVTIEAIVMRMLVGSFKSKFWPELVAAYWDTLSAAHARLAEQTLLVQLDGFGPATFAGQGLGTARDVLAVCDRVVSQIRARRRTDDEDAQVTLLAPSWLRSAMRTDFTRQAPGDDATALTDGEIASMFAARRITVAWSPDIDVPAEQGGGSLQGWPSVVDLRFFLTGDVAFVDGGSLDLGVVRDSVLNATNDSELFAETFEAAAFLGGGEYVKVTADVCASGETSGPNPAFDPCTTGS